MPGTESSKPPELKLSGLTAKEFLDIVRTLLKSDKEPRSGIEKGVILSDDSRYALLIYNTCIVPKEVEDILPERMDNFARLGENFSFEHYLEPEVMTQVLRELPSVLDEASNAELANKIKNIVIEAPIMSERNPIIAIQPNLCHQENGGFETVDTVLAARFRLALESILNEAQKKDTLSSIFQALKTPHETNPESMVSALPALFKAISESTQKKNRQCVLSTLPNLNQKSENSNAAFTFLDILKKRQVNFLLSPEATINLVVNLLSSYALSQAAKLTVWDTKPDNLMANEKGDLRVIDLGPSSYRLKKTFYKEFANKDPRDWERLRLAYVISELFDRENHRPLLGIDYEACRSWADARTKQMAETGICSDVDAIVNALCYGASYLETMQKWQDHANSQNNTTLSSRLSQTIDTTQIESKRLSRISRKKSSAELPALATPRKRSLTDKEFSTTKFRTIKKLTTLTLAQAAVIREFIPSSEKKLLTDFDEVIGSNKNSGAGALREQFVTLSTLEQDKSSEPLSDDGIILKRINEYRAFVKEHINPLVQVVINNAKPYVERLPASYANPPNTEKAKPDTPELATPIKELIDFNKSFKSFEGREKKRCGAIVGAVLCALVGVGGAASGAFFLISGQDPLTFGILLAASCVIALLTIWPAVVAKNGHINTFAKTPLAKQATNIIQGCEHFVQTFNSSSPAI